MLCVLGGSTMQSTNGHWFDVFSANFDGILGQGLAGTWFLSFLPLSKRVGPDFRVICINVYKMLLLLRLCTMQSTIRTALNWPKAFFGRFLLFWTKNHPPQVTRGLNWIDHRKSEKKLTFSRIPPPPTCSSPHYRPKEVHSGGGTLS